MTVNSSYLFQLLLILILLDLLETAISSVSNWMSANFLTPNPSKTEFLIIGLPQQLSKLSSPTVRLPKNVTLSPVNPARNLGVILDTNLSFAHLICFKIMFRQYSGSPTPTKHD